MCWFLQAPPSMMASQPFKVYGGMRVNPGDVLVFRLVLFLVYPLLSFLLTFLLVGLSPSIEGVPLPFPQLRKGIYLSFLCGRTQSLGGLPFLPKRIRL